MSNIINFGGSGSAGGSSSSITAPIIGKDFTWTGDAGTYQVFQDVETNWRVKFLNSGTFTPLKDMVIDAFLVGGGGSGSIGGAGGGYTNTTRSIVLTANTPYIIEIGAGGAALEETSAMKKGNAGGNTSAFSVTANGGAGGDHGYAGGNGGSGGGSYDNDSKKGYAGGSDGSNGGGPKGGTGQGTTTREFGESTGDLYASGGSGESGGSAGVDNTGDGGDRSKAGGSGIVIIRKHKEIYEASITPKTGISYTNGLDGLSAVDVSMFSAAISKNSDITNETSIVYLDYKNIHRIVSVGNQVTLSLNGTNYAFDIIGFNHDTLTTSTAYGEETATGKAGITFQMHDIFATDYPMNSTNTNSGGWKSSAMRTSTMATMKGYLPDDWEAIIKPVNKRFGNGDGSSVLPGTVTVSDSCFLLAEVEVFGSTTHSMSGEGTQYAYYKAGNSKVKKKNGSSNNWWERSPRSDSSGYFCVVDSNGDASSTSASYSRGMSFGFCV